MIAALLLAAVAADPCVAAVDTRGFVKSQLLECATRDMDRADAALDAAFQDAETSLSRMRRTQLRAAERAWIARRRATCAEARQSAIPSPEINRMRCLVRETQARTRMLRRMR
jgi:uncharacterized protein YecT (DUF1311 family)